jgi:hypothetical protein
VGADSYAHRADIGAELMIPHGLLHRDRALERVRRGRKDHHAAVALTLDHQAFVRSDRLADQSVVSAEQLGSRPNVARAPSALTRNTMATPCGEMRVCPCVIAVGPAGIEPATEGL